MLAWIKAGAIRRAGEDLLIHFTARDDADKDT